MTADDLRQKFLKFFEEKEHKVISSASLIPENDPTALFIAAGMHPLVPYLLGEKHPLGQKLVGVQKCLRTGDIDAVGDAWHLTFFEMLGNWSLGDPKAPDGIGAGYWKEEAIKWSFEFLTDKKWLNLEPERIYVSVFGGDAQKGLLKDEESAKIWQSAPINIKEERIFYFAKNKNWWGPIGETGPCGPCTEMFYDTLKPKCSDQCNPACSCGKYVEIWNDVFMEFNKTQEGKYELLKQKNVDTGMGLERTLAALNGYDNAFKTELFKPIIEEIEKISSVKYKIPFDFAQGRQVTSYRIIADHLKAAVFILGDEKGIAPSNIGQGYVLRRLIRRAIRYGRLLDIKDIFTFKIAEAVINMYRKIYPEIWRGKEFIIEQLIKEEEKFRKTLEKGLKEFGKIVSKKTKKIISGEDVFHLYDTFGFPPELTREMGVERGFKMDEEGFKIFFQKHQELSRTASAGMFKGGLGEAGEETTKLHTATHLLLAALRQILGDGVFQKGSNITAERLRFDFSHPKKITLEQIRHVEDLINQKIKENLIVECEEMTLEEAKKQGAMGVFETKYGEKVKVYSIKNKETNEVFSKEICGGPHMDSTGNLGHLKIIKEEASSAGVRRIKAVLIR